MANGYPRKNFIPIYTVMNPILWFQPEYLQPKVVKIIYWQDVQTSATIFLAGCLTLWILLYISFISFMAYLSFGLLVYFTWLRFYECLPPNLGIDGETKNAKIYLDVKPEQIENLFRTIILNWNETNTELRKLFFFQNASGAVKLGLFFLTVAYIGHKFNTVNIILMFYIAIFTLPVLYATQRTNLTEFVSKLTIVPSMSSNANVTKAF